MDIEKFYDGVVLPGLAYAANAWGSAVSMDDRAKLGVLVIAGQESEWVARRQVGIGQYYPQTVGARGYWQFEGRFGATGQLVGSHADKLHQICDPLNIPVDWQAIYEALAWNDTLACAMARLLLWTDPKPLPGLGVATEETWWQYYLRNWRPGAPDRQRWSRVYAEAMVLMVSRATRLADDQAKPRA